MLNNLELYPKDLTKLATTAHSPESVQYAVHALCISLTNILSSTSLLFPGLRRLPVKLQDTFFLRVYIPMIKEDNNTVYFKLFIS